MRSHARSNFIHKKCIRNPKRCFQGSLMEQTQPQIKITKTREKKLPTSMVDDTPDEPRTRSIPSKSQGPDFQLFSLNNVKATLRL